MVGALPLVQPNRQSVFSNMGSLPTGNHMPGALLYTPFASFKLQAPTGKPENPVHRQWPYCGISYFSLMGCFFKSPVLGMIGWLIALPYYAYALLQQKDAQGRKEEGLYQATANGVFPFIEAKLGIKTGDWIAEKLSKRLAAKYPTSELRRLPGSMYKGIGGLLSLLVLTPTLGDPFGLWLVGKYRERKSLGYGRGNA